MGRLVSTINSDAPERRAAFSAKTSLWRHVCLILRPTSPDEIIMFPPSSLVVSLGRAPLVGPTAAVERGPS